jgi:hypothetical protein
MTKLCTQYKHKYKSAPLCATLAFVENAPKREICTQTYAPSHQILSSGGGSEHSLLIKINFLCLKALQILLQN